MVAMNVKYAAIMAFYGYLTFKAGPDYLGKPVGYLVGAGVSYALWETVGKEMAY